MRSSIIAALAAAAVTAGCNAAPQASGSTSEARAPRFWAWQTPVGAAAHHPWIVEMVRPHTAGAPPGVVANQVCNEVLRRGIGAGELCILLQGFGDGDGEPGQVVANAPALFRHWCDGLEHRVAQDRTLGCERIGAADAAAQWWMTPWASHGIAECRTWMTRFIAAYEGRRVADPRLPAPSRFHFDSEGVIAIGATPHGTVQAFDAMQRDPRWSTETIPGFKGRTMARLYDEAGRLPCDPREPWWSAGNRAWTSWYAGLCTQAADGAMDAAAYEPIRAAWPGCLTSNYESSVRSDGGGNPPRRSIDRAGHHAWLHWSHDASADLQAPVLYWVNPTEQRTGESWDELTLRIARDRIDACIHSFGGPHTNIVPWVALVGTGGPMYGRPAKASPELTRDLLAMCRRRDIHEFIMWSNGSGDDWRGFVEVIRDVWSVHPQDGARVTVGAASGDAGSADALLRHALHDALPVQSAVSSAGAHVAELRLPFSVDRPGPPAGASLEIVVESSVDPGAQLTILLRERHGGALREIATDSVGRARRVTRAAAPDAQRWITADGTIELLLRYEAAKELVASVDCAQVYLRD